MSALFQYLHKNMAALNVQLSVEEVARFRELVTGADRAGEIAGNKYPPGLMETVPIYRVITGVDKHYCTYVCVCGGGGGWRLINPI
jgi:hypothetical protein